MSETRLKIRISQGKTTAMGPGKAELLSHIQKTGSISAAAKQMHMSYRRAWELVAEMNACFSSPLVTSSVGGSHGGGAHLTELGIAILSQFEQLNAKSQQAGKVEIEFISSHLKQISWKYYLDIPNRI